MVRKTISTYSFRVLINTLLKDKKRVAVLDESLCIRIFEYCWNNSRIFEKLCDKRFNIKGARDSFHIRLNTK